MSDTGAVALGAGEVAGTVEPVDEATTARDAAAVGGGADVCATPTTLPGTPQPRQASAIARMTRTMTTVRLFMSTSDVSGRPQPGTRREGTVGPRGGPVSSDSQDRRFMARSGSSRRPVGASPC